MKILPFVTSILDSWHTKLCTSDLGEHVFSFSASGWQNGKKSKRMTRKANFGGSNLFSWVMGPHRAPQPLSTGRGSVSAPHQAKWNRENLQQPDSNPKVPSQEWWKKKKKGIWSLKLGNLWWCRVSLDFCVRNNQLTHNTCIDVLYSTHMLQPSKCPPANTACL